MKKLIIFIMVLTTILMGCGVSQPIQPIPPAPPTTYETIWSGKVSITIETPSTEGGTVIDINTPGRGNVEATKISTMNGGEWDETTNTWELSIPRGDTASLGIQLKNTGGDFTTVYTYISNANPALGVKLNAITDNMKGEVVIPSGETRWVDFGVLVSTEAPLGTSLDDIELAIRSNP